jgi:hypothetical protein
MNHGFQTERRAAILGVVAIILIVLYVLLDASNAGAKGLSNWVNPADPSTYAFLFEDGSYIDLDGNSGCIPTWPCDDSPRKQPTKLNQKYAAREAAGLDRKSKGRGCSMTPHWEAPALWYYMDGDTAPDIAYQDYLSDYAWWLNEEASIGNRLCEGAFLPELQGEN